MTRLTVVLALALAAVSCSSGPGSSSRPRSTATIRIVEPKHQSTVEGPSVTVRVELTGGRVVEKASTTLTPDTGHVHVLLDGTTVTLLAGLEYRIDDVAPGDHLITVEFAANDHGFFNPRVTDIAKVTVT